VCTSRRVRTNTPLQAMVTLNDPVYLEAARHLAVRMRQDIVAVRDPISKGYSLALGRAITESKLKVLEKLYEEALLKYRKEKSSAAKIFGGDEKNVNAESAALVIVANAIMNLDEFVTKS